ncbi:hypothetical protein fugu_016684 [Takifugu bimaculatus]|uniref:SWI/SNF-like complex subunit BAF250 C-terminal domain-containing protein n=1 Tax=Takifugu bimaculatus TaxID=433685 RepID=A0A4Z2BTP5_9TELE|nr:hypothetical protein fugu_016684 [Takifugu bimaculatus]
MATQPESAQVNGEKEEEASLKVEKEEEREGNKGEEGDRTESKTLSAEHGASKLEPKPKQASKYDKLPVKIVQTEELIEDATERLGYITEFTTGLLHWQAGGGDSTSHIQTHFEAQSRAAARSEEKTEQESEEVDDGKDAPLKHIAATIDDVLCARVDALSYAHPARSLPSYPFRVHSDGERDHITLLEDEPRYLDEAPLCTASAWQDSLAKRCLCVSNIVRNLSFIPGNDLDISRHPALVLLLGKLLLLHHQHPERNRTPPNLQRDEQRERGLSSSKEEWWWECLSVLRENAMVTLANISGQLDLSNYPGHYLPPHPQWPSPLDGVPFSGGPGPLPFSSAALPAHSPETCARVPLQAQHPGRQRRPFARDAAFQPTGEALHHLGPLRWSEEGPGVQRDGRGRSLAPGTRRPHSCTRHRHAEELRGEFGWFLGGRREHGAVPAEPSQPITHGASPHGPTQHKYDVQGS